MKKVANILTDKLNTEIRNVKIATTYAVLSAMTSMKYREKIKMLADEYYLSEKRIEYIVKEYQE
tara:strand:+ start:1049 stop:1240 length:192 start_codon:yes stop_codon:yes gene_type:complete